MSLGILLEVKSHCLYRLPPLALQTKSPLAGTITTVLRLLLHFLGGRYL
jgi:hypothetical protein